MGKWISLLWWMEIRLNRWGRHPIPASQNHNPRPLHFRQTQWIMRHSDEDWQILRQVAQRSARRTHDFSFERWRGDNHVPGWETMQRPEFEGVCLWGSTIKKRAMLWQQCNPGFGADFRHFLRDYRQGFSKQNNSQWPWSVRANWGIVFLWTI